MGNLFTANFYKSNRSRLIHGAGSARLILIPANSKLQKNADEAFPFRQDSSFWYLTGLDIADAMLLIDVSNNKEYIILPFRHAHRDQWETPIKTQKVQAVSGVENVLTFSEGVGLLKNCIKNSKSVHTLLPPTKRFQNIFGIQPNPARNIWLKRLRRINPTIKIENIREVIKNLRIIKQHQEIEAIKRAIDVTLSALTEVQNALPNLKYEYEVRAVLHAGFQSRGAGIAFDSVIASGSNNALLHYEKTEGKLHPKDMLLIDAGASVDYYAADITRIFKPLDGMSDRQQSVYDAVDRSRKFAASLMKPGVKHREYEKQVQRFVGNELIKLGLLKRHSSQGINKYFPSMTSHHLGLDVHDIANYNEEFQPGMVLTIEPGIYIAEEGIGVRIEDDVLITKTGIKVLSGKLYN